MTQSTTEATVKVGDVFVESWGYEQTNIDFYEVVEVTPSGKSVRLREIAAKAVEIGETTFLVPAVGNYLEPNGWDRVGKKAADGSFLKRLTTGYRGQPYLRMSSYSGASLWDGERAYYDTLAAGHPGH